MGALWAWVGLWCREVVLGPCAPVFIGEPRSKPPPIEHLAEVRALPGSRTQGSRTAIWGASSNKCIEINGLVSAALHLSTTCDFD